MASGLSLPLLHSSENSVKSLKYVWKVKSVKANCRNYFTFHSCCCCCFKSPPKSVIKICRFDYKIHRLTTIVEIVSILPQLFENPGFILSNHRSQVPKLEKVTHKQDRLFDHWDPCTRNSWNYLHKSGDNWVTQYCRTQQITLWYLISEQDVISEQGGAKISFSTWKKDQGGKKISFSTWKKSSGW